MRKHYGTSYTLTAKGIKAASLSTTVRAVIGPAPCVGCGTLVYWRVKTGWCEASRIERHRCEGV